MHQSAKTEDLGGSRSVWMRHEFPSIGGVLDERAEADVCVVGAGIAGLTSAYECLTRGRSVVVVDGGTIGGGETLRTSAHLSSAIDDRYGVLERRHGVRSARLIAEAHAGALDWIERFCEEHHVDCRFARVDGYLLGSSKVSRQTLEDEVQAARRAGLDAELVESSILPELGPWPAIRFARQAEFDAGAYVAALAAAVIEKGGRIYENVVIDRVEDEERPKVVSRDGRTITAESVIVATNAPITSMVSIPLKQAAYRSYVITLRIPKGRVARALYWDLEEPYHYVRVTEAEDADHDLLVVGGEDRKTGQDDDPAARFVALHTWARERFPYAEDVCHRWSGQIMEPFDGVGFVGRDPGSEGEVFLITGDSGDGLTLGTLGGRILADLVEGTPNEAAEVFDPARTVLHAPGPFLRENANVAAQYVDLVSGGEVRSRDGIEPGGGAVVRDGVSLLAVFRDERGDFHSRSAICPHLDGVVHWNAAEQSWDCPCHGSRFDRFGHLISGPATSDLASPPSLPLERPIR